VIIPNTLTYGVTKVPKGALKASGTFGTALHKDPAARSAVESLRFENGRETHDRPTF
jgi:hypothetical protein